MACDAQMGFTLVYPPGQAQQPPLQLLTDEVTSPVTSRSKWMYISSAKNVKHIAGSLVESSLHEYMACA
jgi:hypothetical protein